MRISRGIKYIYHYLGTYFLPKKWETKSNCHSLILDYLTPIGKEEGYDINYSSDIHHD